MTGYDSMVWTWTAPTGEVFQGSADFIDGVKRGWEARTWSLPVPRRCKFSSTCEYAHPDDIANHPNGEAW